MRKNKSLPQKFHIKPLSNAPEAIAIAAHWLYLTWYVTRDIPFKVIQLDFQKRYETSDPLTFIAFDDELPVGMATLKKHDLWSRKDLTPWLASLFVVPEYRKRGIARKLEQKILQTATEKNLERLYLFLDHREIETLSGFYKRSGWQFLEYSQDNDGNQTEIYYFSL